MGMTCNGWRPGTNFRMNLLAVTRGTRVADSLLLQSELFWEGDFYFVCFSPFFFGCLQGEIAHEMNSL